MNPEIKIQPPNKTLNRLTDILFYSVMFIFIVALAFPHNQVGNWYQQFIPFPTGGQIRDVCFVDSLIGFAVSDSSILKTTNSGDNWTVKQTGYYIFNRIVFLNTNTGFASGGNNTLLKTINSGENWTPISLPGIYPFDMSVVSQDSIWLVNTNSLTGGVFRTTNGGASWQQQLNLGNLNPNHIYMFNGRIGFIAEDNSYLRKTTDGGLSWNVIPGADGFLDIYFADSLLGWKSSPTGFKKTINGGVNWITQNLPSGGIIQTNPGASFSNINKDTIWSTGGYLLYPNNTVHGFLNRTTNGGDTWYFQIPDTSLNPVGGIMNFINNRIGWVTSTSGGIHTTNGGDTTFLLPVNQISTEVPKGYKLYQNYPNPFNPVTNIKYAVKGETSNVKLVVFDITGKEITKLVNQEQSAGTYEVDFNGSNYSSGIYFYSLTVEGIIIETKKMLLIK